jgi:phosphoglycolate phosphatase
MLHDYKVYIFDFDGTLADSRINIANSLNSAFTLYGYARVPNRKIYPLIGKQTLEEHFVEFYPHMPQTIFPKLIDEFRTHQLVFLTKELQLFPHVVEVLNELKRRDKSLAILTTKGTAQVTAVLELLGIKHLFGFIYGRDLLFGRKPEGRCVDYILSQLAPDVKKKDVVMVGDTRIDAQTAMNSGVDMIGVGFGIGSRKELLSAGAISIINSFQELVI